MKDIKSHLPAEIYEAAAQVFTAVCNDIKEHCLQLQRLHQGETEGEEELFKEECQGLRRLFSFIRSRIEEVPGYLFII